MRSTRLIFRQLTRSLRSARTTPTLTQTRTITTQLLLGGLVGTTAAYVVGNSLVARCKDKSGEHIRYKSSKLKEYFSAMASIEYNGEEFMTGRDFLDAWITDEYYEKPKIELYTSEYETMIDSIKGPSERDFNKLFSSMSLISYPDYIFLRSILYRPDDLSLKSFKMLDLDQNGYISADEYYSLYKMFTKNDEGDPVKHLKTTIRVLLFNHDDDGMINLDTFKQLLKDVKKNCLKAEFNKFRHKSNNKDTISVQGFMRAVLRRTKISQIQRARLLDKAEVYTKHDVITFNQFKSMTVLLNNFSDFEVAVRMYQIAKKPLARDVFKRAAYICSGEELDNEIVDILFYIFDEAGDGHLSHSEFVNIMKEMETNVASQTKDKGSTTIGQYFRKCVRNEMIRSYA